MGIYVGSYLAVLPVTWKEMTINVCQNKECVHEGIQLQNKFCSTCGMVGASKVDRKIPVYFGKHELFEQYFDNEDEFQTHENGNKLHIIANYRNRIKDVFISEHDRTPMDFTGREFAYDDPYWVKIMLALDNENIKYSCHYGIVNYL